MAKFETVPLAELKTRLPAKLMPLVEEYKEKLGKLSTDQGAKLVLEKGDDAKDLRKALKAAATSLSRRIRFPFRGEEGSLSFYLEGQRGRRGRKAGAEARAAEAPKRRELIMTITEREKTKPTCPECKGTKVVPQLGGFMAQTAKKS